MTVGVAFLLLVALGSMTLFGKRRQVFDPERIAAGEVGMWQAYYGGRRLRLFGQLLAMLRRQFGLSWYEAFRIGHLLARSAMRFKDVWDDYEAVALPDLAAAYERIRRATGRGFDPAAVARAELAWWVARRTPGDKAPEVVGRRIGELYAAFYERQSPDFAQAGWLRAQAAYLRDQQEDQADWEKIRAMLVESYRLLGGYE
ncbi:MAG: hypothetical protein RBU25_08540 [Lentisphaeria bacterium]|jgi:hypothetical protein|nr:hypothetical protein [Lentisphaeria bacterium]